ncbi:DNA-binding NarL/FixJ family response regulator [Clavibacter sp. B3I6]|jgi:DNA-binding NarL/FixJ family response regulator|uniref:sigma factor-like helix-turn-helix DNA-binding protein n=1 Tax=Clavibacter sp. B3I6 TaxID=3042268 RepID=UPI00278217EE|nr:sigma factor-like helix-turn-helix DNA-binding protein [Clavibacter sp. B3I6]MDQ0743892.1 DNA-binding NarL/FixJ family response regulator [Clavibacter sp. B3I6]
MTTLRDPGASPLGAARRQAPRPVRVGVLMGSESALDEVCAILRARAPEIDVVVSTTGWLQLIRSPRFPTDIVVVDHDLPDAVSIEGRIRSCRAAGAAVVVLSRSGAEAVRRRLLDAGVAALVMGPMAAGDIVTAVRGVAAGARSGRRQVDVAADDAAREAARAFVSPRLSQGEEQALRLYVTGRSTQDVAQAMNVQYETAKTYLRRARAKYREVGRVAGRRADLIERAAEDGYLR